MHVLITRPEHDAADLKARIEALGYRVTVAPLLRIEFTNVAAGAVDEASAIVATSRNGLRALAASSALAAARLKPIFVVGPATAALARQLGFTSVKEGQGSAADLVPLITDDYSVKAGPLVHLAGDHTAFDLGDALLAKGIQLQSLEAYRSVASDVLPVPVPALLAAGALDAVILMSPRSARTWLDLTEKLPQATDLTKLTHVCLSPAVAQALGLPSSGRIEIARQPNADEIVALVYRLAGRAKTG